MLKSNKFYLVFLPAIVVSLILVALVIYKYWPTKNQPVVKQTVKVFNLADYQIKARESFSRLTVDQAMQAGQIKQDLLNLKISGELKDVHLRLVMLAASLEKYNLYHDKSLLSDIKKSSLDLSHDYPWLVKSSS